MIAGDTLTVHYRFCHRTERGMRSAKEIEQDIRRRERADRERHGTARGELSACRGISTPRYIDI